MKNIEEIQTHLREIGRLENEADRIYRDTDGDLFANPPDILLLIKLRELYGWLEETVDACKDVASHLRDRHQGLLSMHFFDDATQHFGTVPLAQLSLVGLAADLAWPWCSTSSTAFTTRPTRWPPSSRRAC